MHLQNIEGGGGIIRLYMCALGGEPEVESLTGEPEHRINPIIKKKTRGSKLARVREQSECTCGAG